MALSDYTDLRESIINWSHRADMDLLIDDFIRLAEIAMFSNDDETLAIRAMETNSTASVSTVTTALPTGFIEMRSIRLDVNTGGELYPKSPDALPRRSGTGRPRFYAIRDVIEFDVAPDQTYTVEYNYIQKPTGLSSSNTTNVIMTNYPNIYLYGALWALFTHVDDEPQAMKYWQRFINSISGANQEAEQGRFGVAPYARVEGCTP